MTEELQMRRVRELNDPDVVSLVAKSDKYLSSLYPPESNHAEPLNVLVGEDYLLSIGVRVARLEAGPLQPEALSLYRKLGYADRGPFGSYRADPLSVFMEKTLSYNSSTSMTEHC